MELDENAGGTDGSEVHRSSTYNLTAYNGNQYNMEVNATATDTVSQTISGLTAGQYYLLSWGYAGRTGGHNANQTNPAWVNYIDAPQELQVYFGGKLVTTDFWGGTPSAGGDTPTWQTNSFLVRAGAASETLSFVSVYLGGNATFGNEISDVSLIPEPVSAALLVAGMTAVGFASRRRRAV